MVQLSRERSIQCTFIRQSGPRVGEQCKKWAIRGATVCSKHGGQLPTVKAAAARRIDEARAKVLDLVDPAIKRLAELVDSEDDGVALRAVAQILDRSGFVVVKKSEVEKKVISGVDEQLAALLKSRRGELEELRELKAIAEAEKVEADLARDAEISDAVVVPEDDDPGDEDEPT